MAILQDDGHWLPFALTCERAWLDNQHDVSCIPTGSYTCKRGHFSTIFPNNFQVMDVPNRTGILIHRGNVQEHSKGCMLVAEQFEIINNESGVAASDKGFTELMFRTSGVESFNLEILSL